MELPFTVVFEPPSQSELRALLRMRGTWVAGVLAGLAIGTVLLLTLVFNVGQADAGSTNGGGVPLELSSRPSGAGVWLDGRERGRTPVLLRVEPGSHSVVFKARDALDGQYIVQVGGDGAALHGVVWRRQPALIRLRPALPGAVLSDVRFLADGQLALSIGLPPDARRLQAWRLEPSSGALEPLLTDASGTRLTVAADGLHIAYLGYDVGPPAPSWSTSGPGAEPARGLWLVSDGRTAPDTGWRAPLEPGESLLDASWSPGAERLLVATGQVQTGGAQRTRLWFVDADVQVAREVLALPSELVAGSELWSPDGRRVAFLAHAGAINALCLLELDGGFRYLADLDPSAASPLAYPAAAWSADSQRLVFVAPPQRPPGQLIGFVRADSKQAVYVASGTDAAPVLLGDTDVDRAVWREDGQLLGVGRLGFDGALDVRLLGQATGSQHVIDLPLRPAAGYAAVWDGGHARLLIASPAPTGGVDYWLAMLGLEGEL